MSIISFDIYFNSFEDEYNEVGLGKAESSDKGFLNNFKIKPLKNSKIIIFFHLDMNSIRNKSITNKTF